MVLQQGVLGSKKKYTKKSSSLELLDSFTKFVHTKVPVQDGSLPGGPRFEP